MQSHLQSSAQVTFSHHVKSQYYSLIVLQRRKQKRRKEKRSKKEGTAVLKWKVGVYNHHIQWCVVVSDFKFQVLFLYSS